MQWLTAHCRQTVLGVLRSLNEAFLPPLPDEARKCRLARDEAEPLAAQRLAKYFEYPGAEGHSPGLATEALELCDQYLPPEKRTAVKIILWLLSTRLGTLLLGGTSAFVTWLPPFAVAFDHMSVRQREAVLLSWRQSFLAPLRQAYKAVQGLVMFTLFSAHDATGRNMLWSLVDYSGIDPHKPQKPSAAKLKSEAVLLKAMTDLRDWKSAAELRQCLQRRGLELQDGSEECAATVRCDAVVVGSGAGGGVAAAVLAAAGLKVVVLEKGGYTKAGDLSTLERDAYEAMYERCGLLMATEDGGMNIMAGATLGGGTRINWSVSFRTPQHVLREWADVHGLPNFTSERYKRAMDAVCARLGVDTGVRHNKANKLLWDALESLGADVEEMPRNCRDSERCGHCPHGCASGHKQDTTATFLPDAAKAGAEILTGCYAVRVLSAGHGNSARRKRALGVRVHPGGRADLALDVLAPIVVSSCGSLHTPALLLRSGLTCRGNTGRHLHLHCAAVVAANFPRKSPEVAEDLGCIRLWEGPVMSTYSREAADWAGTGYGPLVSMTSAHPGLLSAGAKWEGAVAFREMSAAFPWMALCCTYVRDRDSGQVTIGADGEPRVHYWPSAYDQNSILKGLALGARAMVEAGAERIFTSQPAPRSQLDIKRNADGSLARPQDLEDYVQGIFAQGVKPAEMALFSLHQMGSCRMGASPDASVADGEGECWDCAGLYIADASAFPTASGVNPMITAESIAYMVAEGIAARRKQAHTAPHGR